MASNNHTIVVNAEVRKFSEFKRDLTETSKLLDSIGKKKFQFKLDDNTIKNYKKQFQELNKTLETELKKNIDLLASLDRGFSKLTGGQRNAQMRQMTQVAGRINEYQSLYNRSNQMSGGGVNGGGGNEGPQGGQEEGGSGGRGRSFLASSGLGRYATAYGAYRIAKQMYDTEFSLAGQRLKLRGLGAKDNEIGDIQRGGTFAGFTNTESLNHGISLRRTTGSTEGLAGAQLFSRASGAEVEDTIGIMGNFRQSGMKNNESLKAIKDIYADAISKGFDESRAFDVLESISGYTAAMSQKTGINVDSVRSIISGLMGSSDFFTQNTGRAMTAMEGAQSLFNSSGPTSVLSMRTLQQAYPGMSTGQLIGMRTLGLTGQPGGKGFDMYNSMIGQIGGMINGKDLKFGGGMNQMSSEKQGMFASAIQKTMGLPAGEISKQVVESFLKGDKANLKNTMSDVGKSLDEKQFDIMTSIDKNVIQIAASVSDEKDSAIDKIAKFMAKQMMGGVPKTNPETGHEWGFDGYNFLGDETRDPEKARAQQKEWLKKNPYGKYLSILSGQDVNKYNSAQSALGFNNGQGGSQAEGGGWSNLMSTIGNLANGDSDKMFRGKAAKKYWNTESDKMKEMARDVYHKFGVQINNTGRDQAETDRLLAAGYTADPNSNHRFDKSSDGKAHGLDFNGIDPIVIDYINKKYPDFKAAVHNRGTDKQHTHVDEINRTPANPNGQLENILSAFVKTVKKYTQASPVVASEVTHRSKHRKLHDE